MTTTITTYILFVLLCIAVYMLVARESHRRGRQGGLMDGFEGGFNEGVDKTLKLLSIPLKEKYDIDIVDYFNDLMNDPREFRRAFGTQPAEDDE